MQPKNRFTSGSEVQSLRLGEKLDVSAACICPRECSRPVLSRIIPVDRSEAVPSVAK
jgi:hypothetical protein